MCCAIGDGGQYAGWKNRCKVNDLRNWVNGYVLSEKKGEGRWTMENGHLRANLIAIL
jgi:hypothetical protein